MVFSPKIYYNHFIGKGKQPVSGLEHKIFTKLKKRADQLKLPEMKVGSEEPNLNDHLQASRVTSKSQFNRR